jgi:hypothetical protein
LYGFVFEPFDTFLDAGFFICAIVSHQLLS